jgi:uncharacterized membrane protein YhaH (DUF805 family)
MFKNPFSFNGRISRLEYGLSNLIFLVPHVLIMPYMDHSELSEQLISIIIYILLLWFVFAQDAKLCHDRGANGWWQLLPFYGLILLFYNGNIGPNEYGDDPKGLSYGFAEGAVDSAVGPINDVDEDGINVKA